MFIAFSIATNLNAINKKATGKNKPSTKKRAENLLNWLVL